MMSNDKSFYDLSSSTISRLVNINPLNGGGYSVSSPFLTQSTLRAINESMNQYNAEITKTKAQISSLKKSKTKLTHDQLIATMYEIRTRNKAIANQDTKAIMNEISSLTSKLNTTMSGIEDVKRQLPFNRIDGSEAQLKINSLQQQANKYRELITTEQGKLKKIEIEKAKAKPIYTGIDAYFSSGTSLAPDVQKYVDDYIIESKNKEIARLSRSIDINSGVRTKVESIIDGIGDVQFTTFNSTEELSNAFVQLQYKDKQVVAATSSMYGKALNDKGIVVHKKRDFIPLESVSLNPLVDDPSKRMTYSGIDAIGVDSNGKYNKELFDHSPENIERFFSPIDSDSVYESINSNNGMVTKQEVDKVKSMVDGYMEMQSSLELEEQTILHNRVRENIKPSKRPNISAEKMERLRASRRNTPKKTRANDVIDSFSELDASVRDELKLRGALSKPVSATLPPVFKSGSIDKEMLIALRSSGRLPHQVNNDVGRFLASINGLEDIERMIQERQYGSIAAYNTPFYGMPYGTDEEIASLVKKAREYKVGVTRDAATQLQTSIRDMDFSASWKQSQAAYELERMAWEDSVVDGSLNDTTSRHDNGLDSMYLENKKQMMAVNNNEKQMQVREIQLTEDDMGNVLKVRQRDTEAVNIGLTRGTESFNIRSIKNDIRDGSITARHLEQGYVISDNGNKVALKAYDEFNELLSMSTLRGEVDTFGVKSVFSPAEWQSGEVKFGDNTYSIRKFSEYYNSDVRKAQNEMLMRLPGTQELVVREKVQGDLEQELQRFVETSTERINYPARVKTTQTTPSGKVVGTQQTDVIVEAMQRDIKETLQFVSNSLAKTSGPFDAKSTHLSHVAAGKMTTVEAEVARARIAQYTEPMYSWAFDSLDKESKRIVADSMALLNGGANATASDFLVDYLNTTGVSGYRAKANYNSMPKTRKVSRSVGVPVFREESVPVFSKRTKGALENIPGVRPSVNLENYKDVFEKYGINPDDTPIGKKINSYFRSLEGGITLTDELSETDKKYLDGVMEYRRLRMNADAENKQRSVIVDRDVDKKVQSVFDDSITKGSNIQMKGDILSYKTIGQTDKYATLEANHILFKDMSLDIEYDGDKTIAELIEDASNLYSKLGSNDIEMKNMTIYNDAPIVLGRGTDGELGIKRSTVFNDIMSDMKDYTIDTIDKNGNSVRTKHSMNKTALDVIESNWAWMKEDEKAVGIAYEAVSDAINEVTELDIQEAAERLNVGRMKKGLDLIDLSNPMSVSSDLLQQTIESAVHQRSKGKIIKGYFEDSISQGVEPAVRVALKTLDHRGEEHTVANVKAQLRLVRDEFKKAPYDSYYKYVDEIMNNDDYINEQLRINNTRQYSVETMFRESEAMLDVEETFDDRARDLTYLDPEHKQRGKDYASQNKKYTDRVADAGREVYDEAMDNYNLFVKELNKGIDQEILLKEKKLSIDASSELFLNNYASYDFSGRWVSNKVPKKRRKELKSFNGNWKELQRQHGLEWLSAKERVSKRANSLRFRNETEAMAILSSTYDDIVKSTSLSNELKETLLTNREANVRKALEMSKIKTQKGKVVYSASGGYLNIRESIMDGVRQQYLHPLSTPGHVTKRGITKGGIAKLADTDKVAKALVSVYDKRGVSGIADVFSMVGNGTVLGGLQTLFGSDPNNILKGMLVMNPDGKTAHKGLSINSKEGMKFFQMMGNIMGDIKLTGRGKASDGRHVGFTLDKYLGMDGITGGIATSFDGKAYRMVNSRDEAVTTVAKNLLYEGEVFLSKASPTANHISASLTEKVGDNIVYNLMPSSIFDYDQVAGKFGDSIADPTTSMYNLKKALGKDNSKVTLFDFETSGLLGKIDDDLFVPVELGYLETFTKDGKIMPGKAKSMYARPSDKVADLIFKDSIGDYNIDENYTQLVNNLVDKIDKNDNIFNLYKNYAKYDKEMGSVFAGGMQLVDDFKDGAVVGKAIKLDNGTLMSPVEYVEDMLRAARDTVDYMQTPTGYNPTTITGPVLPMEDFIKKTHAMLSESDYIVGHNSNAADLNWLGHWMQSTGMGDDTQSLALKGIDSLEVARLGLPGRSNYKLENFISELLGDKTAHLASVDVEGTRSLINTLLGTAPVTGVLQEMDTPMRVGDVFVKTGLGNQGVENLPKGVFRFKGIDEVNEQATRTVVRELKDGKKITEEVLESYSRQVLVLEDMITGATSKVPFQNVASLKREAMNNWKSFGQDAGGAINFHNARQATDINRTVGRAFTYSRWNNYTAKGKRLQGETQTVLKGLRDRLDNGLLDSETMRVIEGAYGTGEIDDLGLLALSNIKKLSDKGLLEEQVKADFRESRLPEYKAFAEYADSDEGKLIKDFLYEGDLRQRAYNRGEKSKHLKDYQRSLHDIVKEVRSTTPGLEDYTIDIPNRRTLITITPDDMLSFGSQKHNINIEDAFKFDIDFTNRSTIERSLWNGVSNIQGMIESGGVLKGREAKTAAINEYVMPLLAKALDGTSAMDDELKATIEALRTNASLKPGAPSIDIDQNLSKTMAVLSSRLSIAAKNNEQFIENLATVKEVDMHKVIPKTHESYQTVMESLQARFAQALGKLDDDLATVSRVINGEPTDVIDGNVKFVQGEVIKMLKANDKRYKRIVKQQFGITDADAVLANLNLDKQNSAGAKVGSLINTIGEAHYNAKNPELSYKSAAEIIAQVNSLASDITPPTRSNLDKVLKSLSIAKGADVQKIYDSEPDFFNYLRNAFSGFYTDESNIKQLNQQVETAVDNYINSFDNQAIMQLRNKKHELYKELSARASLVDYRNGNVMGEVSDTVYNSHLTKYRAMEALGLIQQHDGKRYTGRIGLAGSFTPGVDLDPSKVIVASSPGGKFSGYALTDMTIPQMQNAMNDRYTPKATKRTISEYMERVNASLGIGTDGYAEAAKEYNQRAYMSYVEKQKDLGEQQLREVIKSFSETQEVSKVAAINQSIKEASQQQATQQAKETAAQNTMKSVVNDVEIPWSLGDTAAYQKYVGGFNKKKSEAFASVRKMMGSKVVRYSAVAASAATALALTTQYTSSGRTENEMPHGGAPSVDGNYQKEYNGVDRKHISIPKTVRLEENGKGLNITARAKNRNYVTHGAIDDAVKNSLNETLESNVNIRYQDDRETINQEYVQGLFASALR